MILDLEIFFSIGNTQVGCDICRVQRKKKWKESALEEISSRTCCKLQWLNQLNCFFCSQILVRTTKYDINVCSIYNLFISQQLQQLLLTHKKQSCLFVLFQLEDIWPYGYMIRQRSIIIIAISLEPMQEKPGACLRPGSPCFFFGSCPFVNLHDSTSP